VSDAIVLIALAPEIRRASLPLGVTNRGALCAVVISDMSETWWRLARRAIRTCDSTWKSWSAKSRTVACGFGVYDGNSASLRAGVALASDNVGPCRNERQRLQLHTPEKLRTNGNEPPQRLARSSRHSQLQDIRLSASLFLATHASIRSASWSRSPERPSLDEHQL